MVDISRERNNGDIASVGTLFELVPKSWQGVLANQSALISEIDAKIAMSECNPTRNNIFRALYLPPEKVKVVILGQDPYPKAEDATGLAFSIPKGSIKFPPTLKNILSEYTTDLAFNFPNHGDLEKWSDEGVLLLNPIFTCQQGISLSHADFGWEEVTKTILSKLCSEKIVGILWGKNALRYAEFFASNMVISSPHPSPLSAYRGFFGSRPFTRANSLLIGAGSTPIDWTL